MPPAKKVLEGQGMDDGAAFFLGELLIAYLLFSRVLIALLRPLGERLRLLNRADE